MADVVDENVSGDNLSAGEAAHVNAPAGKPRFSRKSIVISVISFVFLSFVSGVIFIACQCKNFQDNAYTSTDVGKCFLIAFGYDPKHPGNRAKNQAIYMKGVFRFARGVAEDKQGHLAKAEALYKEALDQWSVFPGCADQYQMMCLSVLATNLQKQHKLGEAKEVLKRALDCAEKLTNPHHRVVAHALEDLGDFYAQTGRYKEALPLVQRSLDIDRAGKGNDINPFVLWDINALCRIHTGMKAYQAAEVEGRQALSIAQKLHDDEWAFYVGENLARCLYRAKKYGEAEACYLTSLATAKRCFGEKSWQYEGALLDVAWTYCRQAKHDMADRAIVDLLRINDARPVDRQVGMDDKCAVLYVELGEPAKAEPLLRKYLAWYERNQGYDGDMSDVYDRLAYCAQLQKKDDVAQNLYKQAMAQADKQGSGEAEYPEHVLRDYPRLLRESHREALADKLEHLWKARNDPS